MYAFDKVGVWPQLRVRHVGNLSHKSLPYYYHMSTKSLPYYYTSIKSLPFYYTSTKSLPYFCI